MSIISKIEDDFKEALKNKDELKVSTLRLLKNALHNQEIEKQRKLNQEEIWQVINREIKQRKEAILEYQKAKREDLALKEKKEIEIISFYLPPALSEDEIKKEILGAISETGASTPSDFGNVMKAVMPKIKGQAEGSKIAELVKEQLQKEG